MTDRAGFPGFDKPTPKPEQPDTYVVTTSPAIGEPEQEHTHPGVVGINWDDYLLSLLTADDDIIAAYAIRDVRRLTRQNPPEGAA